MLVEKELAVQRATSAACVEWEKQHRESTKADIEEKIVTARKVWIQQQETEFQRRLSNAIAEARKIWDEEQRLKNENEVKIENKKEQTAHKESREQEINRVVELALSKARADWLKNEEEIRQREIEQAVEVAITNAVAEAREQWQKEQRNTV